MSSGALPTYPPLDPSVDYYTDLLPLNGNNFITLGSTSVTVNGYTNDSTPGDSVITLLLPYEYNPFTPVAAQSGAAALTATGFSDGAGAPLTSYSTTLSAAGLAPGLYEAVSLDQFTFEGNTLYAGGGPTGTQIVSIGATQAAPATPLVFSGTSPTLTADGRYLVYTAVAEFGRPEVNGDLYEYDLQTGAEIDLTATGRTATGAFAPNHYATPMASASGNYFDYPTFSAGGYTFSTILDPNRNAAQGGYDPLPVVTTAEGAQVITGFYGALAVAGALAASSNGNVLLSDEPFENLFDPPGKGNQYSTDPLIYISYLSAAPSLTINEVNGTDQIKTGATAVTLTGTCDAIGQAVEIDLGTAGADSGSAIVGADGNWSFVFNPASFSGTSLYIEASVTGTQGTPARANETAQFTVTPPPGITAITGTLAYNEKSFGPGQTLTLDLDTSTPVYVTGTPALSLSNGQLATYVSGSGSEQLAFTYVPGIQDSSSTQLAVTGLLLPGGASITDAAQDALQGPFTQALGLSLQTSPVIIGLDPSGGTDVFLTNSDKPLVEVGAEVNETITLYDNASVVGTGVVPYYGAPGLGYAEITLSSALPEGQSTLTAMAQMPGGGFSSLSAMVVITVDTVPPAETITSLAVNSNDTVSLADQAALSIVISGEISSALQPGETVYVVLPGGERAPATPTSPTAFALTLSSFEAEAFGVNGSISAYIEDAADNLGAPVHESFTAAAARSITLVTAAPADPLLAADQQPALSGNAAYIAFQGAPQSGTGAGSFSQTGSISSGIYVEDLATKLVTLAAAGAEGAALSNSGSILAYDARGANYDSQVYVKNLNTGIVTLLSPDAANPATGGDGSSLGAAISADGNKVVFASDADDLVAGIRTGDSNAQIYESTLSGGTLTGVTLVTTSATGSGEGDGNSSGAAISADGSTVAFISDDPDLLPAGDPHTGKISGFDGQVFVKALTANASAGLQAGQVVLVSGLADGTVGNGDSSDAVLSANGQYVAFISTSDNLAPANLAGGVTLPADTAQVYVKNLATGVITLVSQTPAGVVGNYGALSVAISADGSTVVFSDSADNLGGGASGGQVYAATLANGNVSSLSLLSVPGAIPGDGQSNAVSVSADGTQAAFQSQADNLVAGTGGGYFREHVYVTGTGALAPHAPTGFTVTSLADSGAGSLRAVLAGAGSGDTITFASTLDGGTIALASSLSITDGVTISGTGDDITLDGEAKVTVFTIDNHSGTTTEIAGLTLANGNGIGTPGADNISSDGGSGIGADGGAAAGAILLQAGPLDLAADDFSGNTAAGGKGGDGGEAGGSGGGAGAAIYVAAGATLTASNLVFSGNTATAGPGGVVGELGDEDHSGAGGAAGGAIYVASTGNANLNGLSFSANTASGGNAGYDYAEKGAGANGGVAGGAIYAGTGATLSAAALSFTDNTASGGMGGPLNSTLPNNDQLGYKGAGYGGSAAGAVFASPGVGVTPVDFTYSGNSATTGQNGDGKPDGTATAFADSNISGTTSPHASGGSAQDGYIIGGTVAYINGSGTTATTGPDGSFTISGGTGPIFLTGGTDSATGLLFSGTLAAPNGSAILSPLTTLVEEVGQASGTGPAAASTLVANALQIPSGTDFTQYDAEAGLLSAATDSSALEFAARVFAADNYLQSLEQLIGAAGGNATIALRNLAQEIAAGDTIDLTNPATLINAAGLSTSASAAVLAMADTVINAVESQFTGTSAPSPLSLFDEITGGAIAIQKDAVQAISLSSDIGSAANMFDAGIGQILATDDAIAMANNGALLTIPCYAAGTRILGLAGEIVVENIRVGDRLVTVRDGGAVSRAVIWVGSRTIDLIRHPAPARVQPIRIRAGAIAPGVPERDLRVSPNHAIYLDGLLFEAASLVNGITILQETVLRVTYHHVELDEHDILLAEGLPAESFLDTGNRAMFAGGAIETLHPDFAPMSNEGVFCAPMIRTGPALATVTTRLTRRAILNSKDFSAGFGREVFHQIPNDSSRAASGCSQTASMSANAKGGS